jgi:glycosyltransferase involved in cell wall biosynthesis
MISREKANVSVVMPCYNSSKSLLRAFSSIAKQNLIPSEVILIDDASQDNNKTLKLMKHIKLNYKHLFDIVLIENKKNYGPGICRNIGWNKSRYKYIAFLDSDDIWHPQKLEIQHKFMLENPVFDFSGHLHLMKNESFEKMNYSNEYRKIPYFYLLIKNPFITPSVMIKKSVKLRFFKKKRYMEDHLLWIMAGFKSGAILIPKKLAKICKDPYGDSGLSGQLIKMEFGDLENYFILMKLRYVNFPNYIILSILSIVKFIKRLIHIFGLRVLKKFKIEPI